VGGIHDLFKVFEVENIIQSAKMSAAASLERRESRWIPWHYRIDYPDTNDTDWLKHIVLSMGDSLEDVKIKHAPIIRMERGAEG
jgi:succinate dehydrogenase/fumarate reductase flavoprotein subunit